MKEPQDRSKRFEQDASDFEWVDDVHHADALDKAAQDPKATDLVRHIAMQAQKSRKPK